MAHTIEQIIELEPILQDVIDLAKQPGQKERDWCLIYHDCKMIFQELVGFFCNTKELQNHDDYDTFTKYILEIIYSNSHDDSSNNEIKEEDY